MGSINKTSNSGGVRWWKYIFGQQDWIQIRQRKFTGITVFQLTYGTQVVLDADIITSKPYIIANDLYIMYIQ